MKFLRDKSLFWITLDEWLILLFVPECKTMFLVSVLNTASGNLSCHLQWHGSSEKPDFNWIWFSWWQYVFFDFMKHGIPGNWRCSFCSMDWSSRGSFVIITKTFGFFWLKTIVVLVNLISASCSTGVSLTFFLWSYSSLIWGVDRSTICYCCRNWWFQQANLNPKWKSQYQD